MSGSAKSKEVVLQQERRLFPMRRQHKHKGAPDIRYSDVARYVGLPRSRSNGIKEKLKQFSSPMHRNLVWRSLMKDPPRPKSQVRLDPLKATAPSVSKYFGVSLSMFGFGLLLLRQALMGISTLMQGGGCSTHIGIASERSQGTNRWSLGTALGECQRDVGQVCRPNTHGSQGSHENATGVAQSPAEGGEGRLHGVDDPQCLPWPKKSTVHLRTRKSSTGSKLASLTPCCWRRRPPEVWSF